MLNFQYVPFGGKYIYYIRLAVVESALYSSVVRIVRSSRCVYNKYSCAFCRKKKRRGSRREKNSLNLHFEVASDQNVRIKSVPRCRSKIKGVEMGYRHYFGGASSKKSEILLTLGEKN